MAKNTGCSSRGLMVNPSTHMSNYSSRGSDVIFWSPKSTRYRSGTESSMQAKHAYTKRI